MAGDAIKKRCVCIVLYIRFLHVCYVQYKHTPLHPGETLQFSIQSKNTLTLLQQFEIDAD